jgi:hypothetical protein
VTPKAYGSPHFVLVLFDTAATPFITYGCCHYQSNISGRHPRNNDGRGDRHDSMRWFEFAECGPTTATPGVTQNAPIVPAAGSSALSAISPSASSVVGGTE